MKRKPSSKHLLIIVLASLILFQMLSFSRSQPVLVAYGSGFPVEITGGLAFKSDNTLLIEVLTGVLNSSSASLTLYTRTGTFSFIASNDSTIQVSSPDAVEGFDIGITGADSTTITGRFIHRATISTGNNIVIQWGWRLESWVGNYTMFALGISGLILMIASPTWCAMTIKKKGLAPESFEMIMYALLIMCVGFGLVVMWLW